MFLGVLFDRPAITQRDSVSRQSLLQCIFTVRLSRGIRQQQSWAPPSRMGSFSGPSRGQQKNRPSSDNSGGKDSRSANGPKLC